MLRIDTTIDNKFLDVQLRNSLSFDFNRYTIISNVLLSVDIKTKYLHCLPYIVITSTYEILLECNNKHEYYNVEIISYYSSNGETIDGSLKNSVRIY